MRISEKNKNTRLLLSLLLWFLPLLFLLLFYLYPLASIFKVSFSRSINGFLFPFIEAFSSPRIRHIFWFTIFQALLSTGLTLLIGLPGAFLLARFKFRGKSLLQALMGIPFVLPTLVVAAAFNALLGPNGWVNLLLMSTFDLNAPPINFSYTLAAILIAHIFYNTTIILRLVGDFWSRLDPDMENAAQVLGANRIKSFLHVTAPLISPAVLASALLVFIFDFTSFGVILVLGGPHFSTLEVEIYYQTLSFFNLPLAAVLSIVQLVCTLSMTIVYTKLVLRTSKPLNIQPHQITQKRIKHFSRKIVAGIYILFLILLMISPLIALATQSITQFNTGQSQNIQNHFTLNHYRNLFTNNTDSMFYTSPIKAIAISLSYAIMTVILGLALGLPASLALVRFPNSPLSKLFNPLLMLPLGTSAVTLGFGFIVALNHPPLDLRTSVWVIPIAHTLVAFPFIIRSLTPSLKSIRPQLHQAAGILGASPFQVFRQIDLPLIARALVVAGIFAFSISLGEFGATTMISRPEYPTVPILIYRFLSRPGAANYGQALALSTILMTITGLGMLLMERFRIAEIGEF